MNARSVTVRAPGKVNVYLGVGELDDDGYHELATAFQAMALYEDVTATTSGRFTISIEAVGDIDVSGVPLDDRNLALRAAHVLAARTGHAGGVHLHIRKGVPVAGGMGGGSADAAAALVACDALWGTQQSLSTLHDLAAGLGADVPFALLGGTAIGTGRGDELTPALTTGRFSWVLVPHPEGLSTPAVYGRLDELRERHRADLPVIPHQPHVDDAVLLALRAGDPRRLADALHNDLQAAALSLRPDLADTIDAGVRAGALAGIVSGSGPTVALLCEDDESAALVRATLTTAGHRPLAAHAPGHGARILD